MNREDKRARDLARLEEAQRRIEQRLEQQRARIEDRLAQARARIEKKYGEPSVAQQRIVDTALALLDEDGLNNLSLRKLASRLNMQAPALYWHFKNKEALIDYMAEAILHAEFAELVPRHPEESWREWLVATCKRLRNAMRSRRDGARVVAGAHLYPAVTLMKIHEVSMESLTSAGIEFKQANLIVTTAVHFVFGNVIEEQAAPTLEEISQALENGYINDYPHMRKSAEQFFADITNGYDEFEDALRLIIGHPARQP